ncbi:MAG: ankyrin repeat domain-containing protein [Simkaniaceae bacterium]|nr:ankyrin repeat domain-containing protein [Simkaniaceae bacterium]
MSIVREPAGPDNREGVVRETDMTERAARARMSTLSEKVRAVIRKIRGVATPYGRRGLLRGPLTEAISSEDSEYVRLLIDGRADVNTYKRGRRRGLLRGPLMGAISSEDSEYVRFLIDGGADVNAYEKGKWTPLTLASSLDTLSIVRSLLDAGAETELVDGEGRLPLMEAISMGYTCVVNILLTHGADANRADKRGRLPLVETISIDYTYVTNMLLAYGANANRADGRGRLPLVTAILAGSAHTMAVLFRYGADPDLVTDADMAPLDGPRKQLLLIGAVMQVCEKSVRLLIRHGAKATLQDPEGRLPLTEAGYCGETGIALFLLASGASVRQADARGYTPLDMAARRGHTEMVRLLLEKGANPLAHEGEVQPLVLAVHFGQTDTVLCLLKAGADVNRRDEFGCTPLLAAASNPTSKNNRKVMRSLLEYGADPDLVDTNGWSPLVTVTLLGDMTAALLLEFRVDEEFGSDEMCEDEEGWLTKLREERIREKVGETVHTLLMQAIRQGDKRKMDRLFAWESRFSDLVDLNKVSETGQTLLMEAVRRGEEAIVHALLIRKADVHRADGEGWLPLTLAGACGNSTVARLLLDFKADASRADGKGRIPFREAFRREHEETGYLLLWHMDEKERVFFEELSQRTLLTLAVWREEEKGVRFLLERNVAQCADPEGRLPLTVASLRGNVAIALLLLEHGAEANRKDAKGQMPLEVAIGEGHYEMVLCLCTHGADISLIDINGTDETGRTFLTAAIWQRNKKMVRFLLEHGADVNRVDREGCGRLPLTVAVLCEDRDMALILIAYGADPDCADNVGCTPLDEATSGEHGEMESLLRTRLSRSHTPEREKEQYTRITFDWVTLPECLPLRSTMSPDSVNGGGAPCENGHTLR